MMQMKKTGTNDLKNGTNAFFPKNWIGILRPAINEWRPKKTGIILCKFIFRTIFQLCTTYNFDGIISHFLWLFQSVHNGFQNRSFDSFLKNIWNYFVYVNSFLKLFFRYLQFWWVYFPFPLICIFSDWLIERAAYNMQR